MQSLGNCAVASGRTTSTGLATGKRQYDALVITKSVGDASVQEFEALVTNELIKTVTLEILQTNADGTQTVAYRIKLTNAIVTSLTQAEEPGPGATATAATTENVSFSFQRISVESPRIMATDTGHRSAAERSSAALRRRKRPADRGCEKLRWPSPESNRDDLAIGGF